MPLIHKQSRVISPVAVAFACVCLLPSSSRSTYSCCTGHAIAVEKQVQRVARHTLQRKTHLRAPGAVSFRSCSAKQGLIAKHDFTRRPTLDLRSLQLALSLSLKDLAWSMLKGCGGHKYLQYYCHRCTCEFSMISLPVSSRLADHRRRRTVQKPHRTEGRELGQHLAMQAEVPQLVKGFDCTALSEAPHWSLQTESCFALALRVEPVL